MNTFISIISPIRNEEKYIDKCLSSLVNQDYDISQYEIIVIDGMSTDKTREIVKEFAKEYNNIKLLDNPQKTVPYALNIGIKQAKADVIIRVDGHAIVEKDYLQQCFKYLESTKAECVGGVIQSLSETFIGKAIALAMSSPFGVGNARFRTSGKEAFVDSLAFPAYRKEVFDKIGYFDEEFVRCQDDELNYRLRKSGGKIFFTPEIKSKYYTRSNMKKLWQQYFQYGFWKTRILQKHTKMMQLRQFIPPAFVSSLLITGILGIFSEYFVLIFLSILITYTVASGMASIKISLRNGLKYMIILPAIFFSLHTSYGLGFLTGLLRFIKYWIKSK